MARHSIQATKNYDLFTTHDEENRLLKPFKHKRLKASMEKYGFLPCFPIVCVRNAHGALVVKDGQHRLHFAKELGVAVHWVEEVTDFDVAYINSTPKGWSLLDYAEKFAAAGHAAYAECIEFHKRHGLPISIGAALLAGTMAFSNCQEVFIDGSFKVKDREWAEAVAGVYVPLAQLAPAAKGARFLEALMAVCRVGAFEPKRLLEGAKRCREKLVPFATKDACLDALQDIYNYGRRQLIPLKIAAQTVMKERNPAARGKRKEVS